jgi:Leucine-rich repeat (LRR) protein
MPNLESLYVSHNQMERLPLIRTVFPELITLDISHNLFCSEMELIGAIIEASSLTELDFRGNPMFSESFECNLQRIHSFDFLNAKVMSRAGSKYYDEVQKIQEDLRENAEFYGEDD